MRSLILAVIFAAAAPSVAPADLITGLPQATTHELFVQPIIVSNDDGSSSANFLGSVAQESGIKQSINQVWGQAGIAVQWLAPRFWNSTFANTGNVIPPGTRPTSDFEQILTAGQAAGVAAPLPQLSMYFINVVPGTTAPGSELGIEGLGSVDGPASTIRVGSSLPGAVFMGDPLGQTLVAKVIAHEIGHNLGLMHIEEAGNLMLASDPTPAQDAINARLNAGQISLARSSRLLVSVPEPSVAGVFYLVCTFGLLRRRGRQQFYSDCTSGPIQCETDGSRRLPAPLGQFGSQQNKR